MVFSKIHNNGYSTVSRLKKMGRENKLSVKKQFTKKRTNSIDDQMNLLKHGLHELLKNPITLRCGDLVVALSL